MQEINDLSNTKIRNDAEYNREIKAAWKKAREDVIRARKDRIVLQQMDSTNRRMKRCKHR